MTTTRSIDCDLSATRDKWRQAINEENRTMTETRTTDEASPANPDWLRLLADTLFSTNPPGIDYKGALRGAADEIERLKARGVCDACGMNHELMRDGGWPQLVRNYEDAVARLARLDQPHRTSG